MKEPNRGTVLQSFSVDRRDSGKTLAAVLRPWLQLSWSQVERLIESRQIRVNNQICADPARRMKPGERVELHDTSKKKKSAPKEPTLGFRKQKVESMPEGLAVVYSDRDVVVVEKPSGLTTMRDREEADEFGKGRKFLPKTVADYLPKLLGDRRPVIAVHRIDRDTSGLVVFARHPDAAEELGKQFRAHTVMRTYFAICRGTPKPGRIESVIVRDRGDGRRGSGEGEGQRAVTHVAVLKELGALSLVECRLETGRTHQVRIHLGEAGCPLAGERIYDRPIHGAPFPDPSGAKRIMLHAATLGFKHPTSGETMKWQSAMPDDMKAIVEKFKQ